MNADYVDKLRELAQEPLRAAMPRTEQYPSLAARLDVQGQEIAALRRGLSEAIAIIDGLRAEMLRSTVEQIEVRP